MGKAELKKAVMWTTILCALAALFFGIYYSTTTGGSTSDKLVGGLVVGIMIFVAFTVLALIILIPTFLLRRYVLSKQPAAKKKPVMVVGMQTDQPFGLFWSLIGVTILYRVASLFWGGFRQNPQIALMYLAILVILLCVCTIAYSVTVPIKKNLVRFAVINILGYVGLQVLFSTVLAINNCQGNCYIGAALLTELGLHVVITTMLFASFFGGILLKRNT